MTNSLVGDVYAKIIEEVVAASANDFEESGVGSSTLNELQQEWQAKLSARQVAYMPWDPKPAPPVQPVQNPITPLPSAAANGIPPTTYPGYENGVQAPANGAPRIKPEPGTEGQGQYHGVPQPNNAQGGMARAQQLIEQQFGAQGTASINSMQRGGLALPGQQPRPQGLQLPGQPGPNPQQMAQQYQQQQQQAMQRQQQQQLQQQQQNPRIKVETSGQGVPHPQFNQQQTPAQYGQTDGADDGLEEWQAYMARRRAITADQTEQANHLMRDRISELSQELESGLMVSLDAQKSRLESRKRKARALKRSQVPHPTVITSSSVTVPSLPQLDGDADDDDVKDDLRDDEDDEDAINSALDDSDDDQNQINDDEDELGDNILCTYDKVQRVKNKWKCTLKDGVLNTGGKEYLFHKGQGEFEW